MSGGGGSSGVQKIEPPSYQLPYLTQGLSYAQGMLNQGAPRQYSGATVVPFSQQSQNAMAGIEKRASAGSPVVKAAQNYVTNNLNAANPYGNVNNPYLNATFKQAAQQTQGQLASEFARSGRNVQASQPLRSEQLNNLATQIYGGAYDAERNRQLAYTGQQQGLLSAAPGLAAQDYLDLGQLQGVGSQVENLAGQYQQDAQRRFDYEQQAPQMLLDQYLGRVRGTDYGSTSMGTQTGAGGSSKLGSSLGTAAAAGGLAKLLGASNPWVAGAAAAGGLLGLF
jgi:hypothetical protein